MSERVHEYSDPKQELIALLQMDFTSPNTEAWAQKAVAEDDALAGLLANVRSVEGIDARLSSEENAELGQAVERLVEPAPVTNSFKGFIVNEVKQAHAWESQVRDAVAPDRLGLLSGNGIFDPAQVKDIETQALRGYVFDIIHTRTVATDTVDDDNLPELLLKPGIRPSDYVEEVNRLFQWIIDYRQTYDDGLFETLEIDAFLDGARKVRTVSQEEMMADPTLRGILEILRQLHDKKNQE